MSGNMRKKIHMLNKLLVVHDHFSFWGIKITTI